MAIQLDENRVQVAAGKSLVSRFRTDLPDVGSQVAAAGREFGGTLEESGVRTMRAEADKAARDAASSAVIVKDAQGNLVRPPTPGSFGVYASRQFDEVVDGNYLGAVKHDFDAAATDIQTRYLNDPPQAAAHLEELRRGTLAKTDPRLRGTLQGPLDEEVNSRNRGIQLSVAERDRSSAMQDADKLADWYMGKATEAFAIGNVELGNAYLTQSRDSQLRSRSLSSVASVHTADADRLFGEQTRSMLAGTQTVADVLQQSEDGRLKPSQVRDTIDMLNGVAQPGVQVLGKDMDWFTKNMSPEMRRAAAARLERVMGGMTGQMKQEAEDAEYRATLDIYDHGAKLALPGMTDEKRDAFLNRWSRENMSDEMMKGGPYSPKILDAMWQKFGMIPEAALRDNLKDTAGLGKSDVVEAKYQTYIAMQKLSAIGDNGTIDKTGILGGEDAAFWRTYDNLRKNGHDAVTALEATKQLQDSAKKFAAQVKDGGGGDLVVKSFMAAYPSRQPKDIPSYMDREFGTAIGSLPGQLQSAFQTEVETNIKVYGLSFDDAVKNASNAVKANFVQDPNQPGGWARRDEATPTVVGPDAQPTTEWVNKYVKALVDPGNQSAGMSALTALGLVTGMGDKTGGKDEGQRGRDAKGAQDGVTGVPQLYVGGTGRAIPFKAELGKDLQLIPVGNGRFQMRYRDETGNLFPVAGRDGHVAVLDLGKAASKVGDQMQTQIVSQAQAKQRAADLAWNPDKISPAVMEQIKKEGGRVTIPDVAWPEPKASDILVPWQDPTVQDPPRLPKTGSYTHTLFGAESGHSIWAQNDKSTAKGIGQMLDGTYAEVRKKHPDLNLPEVMPDDPEIQTKAVVALTKDNADYLRNAQIDPSDRNLAMAHLLGAEGASRFLRAMAADPEQPASKLVSQAALDGNAAIFAGKTAAQAFDAWAGKWEDTHSFVEESTGGLNDGSVYAEDPNGQAFLDPRGGAPMDTTKPAEVEDLVASGRIQAQVDMNSMRPDLKAYSVRLLRTFPELSMTSGYREEEYNRKQGGSGRSQHLHGDATDLVFAKGTSDLRKKEILDLILMNPKIRGVGTYADGSIHIDMRGQKAYWGPGRTSASLGDTPAWFQRSVTDWFNRKTRTS